MKTRQGFVSNSSSSSFVVRRNEGSFQGEKCIGNKLTVKQVKALEKFGFRKTFAHSPENVPAFHNTKEWEKESKFLKNKQFKDRYNYGYEIVCNQDEVIRFLIENKISFVASCHYGHESIIYDNKTNVIYTGENIGRRMETYGVETLDAITDKKFPVVKMSGDEWIKKNQY